MAKSKSYKQVLDRLALPPDTPQTIKCKMCGGTLQRLNINRYVAFWIHDSKDAKVCAEKNNLFKKPVIASSQPWTGNRVNELWNEMVTEQNAKSKN